MSDSGADGVEHNPVVFDLEPEHPAPSVLDEEREKHRRRAAKFGTDYVEPAKARRELLLESRKERLARPGFATGIDVFSEEEVAKRAARAARFNVTEPQGLQYAPDEEEVAKVRRAKKFGVEYDPTQGAMMDMDLFEERAEVAHDTERRPDAIYLYGVDVMSTGDCLAYFKEYGPTFVEWINDSACVVTFRDRYSAARAMAGRGRPLPADEMTGESSVGLDPTDPNNMPYFWHKGEDFIKENTPVHLIYRMATVIDKKDLNAPRRTRELWKTRPSNQSNKSRRTAGDQSAGQGSMRMDEDGDVMMMEDDEGYDDGMQQDGEGNRRRRRKRNRRMRPGPMVVEEATEDGQQQTSYAAQLEQGYDDLFPSAPTEINGNGNASVQEPTQEPPQTIDPPLVVPPPEPANVPMDPRIGRMGGGGGQGAGQSVDSLLQRILLAKQARASAQPSGNGHTENTGE